MGGNAGLIEILMGEDVERPQVLADVILRKSSLRKLVHAGAELTRMAATEEDRPESPIATASTKPANLPAAKKGEGLRFTQKIGKGAMDRLGAILEGRELPVVIAGFPGWTAC